VSRAPVILGTIMVIDAHLKNINSVNKMKNKKKYTVATVRGKIETTRSGVARHY